MYWFLKLVCRIPEGSAFDDTGFRVALPPNLTLIPLHSRDENCPWKRRSDYDPVENPGTAWPVDGSSWNSKELRLSRGRSMSSIAKPGRNYAVSARNAFRLPPLKIDWSILVDQWSRLQTGGNDDERPIFHVASACAVRPSSGKILFTQ